MLRPMRASTATVMGIGHARMRLVYSFVQELAMEECSVTREYRFQGTHREQFGSWFFPRSCGVSLDRSSFDAVAKQHREFAGVSMVNRGLASNLGRYVYSGGAIMLGLIGFAWGDFATTWQRVAPNVPYHATLSYSAALCEIAGGIALLNRRTARAGAAILTALYSIFALLWVPKMIGDPRIYDSWGNFFEESSLVIAGLVLYASFAPLDSAWARSQAQLSRSFGICAISFALEHILYFSGLPAWIPKWIPPGQIFWAVTTTVCFILAAAAILSGVFASLAARLLAAEIVGFELLVWAPKLFTAPHDHFSWAGNGICLAIAGATWVVADSIGAIRKRVPDHRRVDSKAGTAA